MRSGTPNGWPSASSGRCWSTRSPPPRRGGGPRTRGREPDGRRRAARGRRLDPRRHGGVSSEPGFVGERHAVTPERPVPPVEHRVRPRVGRELVLGRRPARLPSRSSRCSHPWPAPTAPPWSSRPTTPRRRGPVRRAAARPDRAGGGRRAGAAAAGAGADRASDGPAHTAGRPGSAPTAGPHAVRVERERRGWPVSCTTAPCRTSPGWVRPGRPGPQGPRGAPPRGAPVVGVLDTAVTRLRRLMVEVYPPELGRAGLRWAVQELAAPLAGPGCRSTPSSPTSATRPRDHRRGVPGGPGDAGHCLPAQRRRPGGSCGWVPSPGTGSRGCG